MKGRLTALGAGAALIAGGLGIRLILDPAERAATARSSGSVPAIPVSVGLVTAEDVPIFLHGIGTVQAFNMVTVKSRVDGPIVGVDFTEGQEVTAGAVLFRIDPAPYQAALAQAYAAQNKDKAQLESAQLDLDRYSTLVAKGVRTPQSYDQQKALVAQFKAAIDGDQAQIDTAQLNLDYTQIRAPITGRLGARLVDTGNLVRASDGTALVKIMQVRPIFVSFTLPQENLDQVQAEQKKVPLSIEAFSGDDTHALARGELTLIDNSIDAATGTIHLKAQFANED